MYQRQIYKAWLTALRDFILTYQTFPQGAADRQVCGYITDFATVSAYMNKWVQEISGKYQDYRSEESWRTQVGTLALFLHRYEEMKPLMVGMRWNDANISRCADFDPLTEFGLGRIDSFVRNDIFDDGWAALYEGVDGDRRILGEVADDALRWGSPLPEKVAKTLDKPMDWYKSATRTYLDWDTFPALFLADLTEEELRVPTQEELAEIWLARPYVDFEPAQAPRPGI